MPARKHKTKVGSLDPVTDIHQRLQALGYISSDRALMAECHALQMKAMMTTKAVPAMLLQGPPGTGKTFLAETMQKEWGATTFLFYQFAPGVTKEDLVYDLNIANIAMAQAGKWEGEFTAADTIAPGKLVQALLSSQKERTVLLLDELDKASEKIDAFLLDYLQSCRIDAGQLGVVKGNPRNLMVFITMNNQRQMSEPLMRRCLRHELGWPEPAVEQQMILMLAQRELSQLGRPPRADLRIELEAQAPILVTLANEIRGYSQQLKKVPSSPELAEALIGMALLPNRQDWGTKVFKTLLAYPEDRRMAKSFWRTTAGEISSRMARAVDDARARRDREREARKTGGIPSSAEPAVPATPHIEPGKYYYKVKGTESIETIKALATAGVLLYKMPQPTAVQIVRWARETGLLYEEHHVGDKYNGLRSDLDISYNKLMNCARELPAELMPTSTPVTIEPGKYFYMAKGDEPIGVLKALVRDGVLVRGLTTSVASTIHDWARETGIPHWNMMFDNTDDGWDAYRRDLPLKYEYVKSTAKPLPENAVIAAVED